MTKSLLGFWLSIPLNVLRFIIGAFCTTALFWAGILYEHRPAGWPNIAVPALSAPLPLLGRVTLVPSWTLKLPDGPYVKLAALQARDAAAGRQVVALEARQVAITARANVAEAAAQTRIQTITRIQIKEVPTYVDPQAVADCRVNVGFVRLFNAAAAGVDPGAVPGPAGQSDDAAAGVGLDTVARVAVLDLGAGRANAEQLIALQAWIHDQLAANPAKAVKAVK